MKSFFLVFTGVITLFSGPLRAEERHLLSVRMNSLDSLGEKVLPRAAQRLGLDHLRVPDQRLVDTRWKGYDVTVTLRDIHGSVPLSAQAPFTDSLRLRFEPGNVLAARLAAPDARVEMRLAVSIDSHHWYEPGISAEFPVKGFGLSGQAAAQLAVARGDLEGRNYTLSGLEVGRVEIENIGLLSKLFGTVLRHTHLCGGARSLEDCMTRTVNRQLARLLTPQRFLKPLVDPVLAEVSGATRAIFSRDDALASVHAGLEDFQTAAPAARLSWGLKLTPKGAAAACAADLLPSTRPRREPFDWSRAASGDFEVALPQSLLEDYLFAFARQGALCLSGHSSYLGVTFGYEIAPVDVITVGTSGAGELVLRVPLRASLASTPGQRATIEARNLRATLELALDFENGSPKGLCLLPKHVALVDLEGSVAFSGLRVPLLDLQTILEDELASKFPPRLAAMCFLPKHNPLNPELEARLGDRAESAPAHLWTSFELESSGGAALE